MGLETEVLFSAQLSRIAGQKVASISGSKITGSVIYIDLIINNKQSVQLQGEKTLHANGEALVSEDLCICIHCSWKLLNPKGRVIAGSCHPYSHAKEMFAEVRQRSGDQVASVLRFPERSWDLRIDFVSGYRLDVICDIGHPDVDDYMLLGGFGRLSVRQGCKVIFGPLGGSTR
ncbi:MAG: hypothetical protein KDA96_09165 [Planctomycetaceae bacterium]|nr:hypothetical protein [Planctomycetaceae bacterium]